MHEVMFRLANGLPLPRAADTWRERRRGLRWAIVHRGGRRGEIKRAVLIHGADRYPQPHQGEREKARRRAQMPRAV